MHGGLHPRSTECRHHDGADGLTGQRMPRCLDRREHSRPGPGGGRARRRYRSTAAPTACGRGNHSARRPLPHTASRPVRQSRSARASPATSLARNPSRARSNRTAWSRRPAGSRGHAASIRSTSAGARNRGVEARCHPANAGSACSSPGAQHPVAPRKRRKARTATTMLLARAIPWGCARGEDESSQARGGVGAGIVPQGHQEIPEDALVDVERALGQAAVLAHPGAEDPEQWPSLGRRRRRHRGRDHALLAEKPEEPGGGRERLLIRSPGVSDARLGRERDLARLEPLDQFGYGEPRSAQPIGPPGQRSEGMLDPDRPVALLLEPSGKGIDVGGGRACVESFSGDRRAQMGFEHGDLPSVRVARIGALFCGSHLREVLTRCTTTPTSGCPIARRALAGQSLRANLRGPNYTAPVDVAQDRWEEESGS